MFATVKPAPTDLIFGIVAAYNADTHASKINLAIGAYRDNEGKSVVFDCVKQAGKRIYADKTTCDKEYLPMAGNIKYRQLCRDLVFSADADCVKQGRVVSIQALSGTGSLTLVGEFLKRTMASDTSVYVSDPTWPNHITIYEEFLGFPVHKYPYWDPKGLTCDIDAMVKTLDQAPDRQIVILHACAHNPTGEDPDEAQWHQIMNVIKKKNHFAIIDAAYQGFATTDLDKDAFAARLFARELGDLNFAVCQSFAKNMGLYGERAGCLHFVCESANTAKLVEGRLTRLCRTLWSNPPKHGAELVTIVLTDEKLNKSWRDELTKISNRIAEMRTSLRQKLEDRNTPGSWKHITKQIGMFSYSGLTAKQVDYLTEKYHIYMTRNGRISLSGINTNNIDYIADAIYDAVVNCKS